MKYRLTMLNTICLPEDQWGLGIKVLDINNRDFYSHAPGSLVVLSFPQPLNFSSVFPSL
jgi:hypothetical protein